MQNFDISHLPQPVHDAVLHVLEVLVAAFPVAPAEAVLADVPSAANPPHFPRSATELLILEALEALAPMPASPIQVASMVHKPHLEVRTILQALAMLGTIAHPRKGFYARYALPEEDSRPSTRFAAQISALCTPHAKGVGHV